MPSPLETLTLLTIDLSCGENKSDYASSPPQTQPGTLWRLLVEARNQMLMRLCGQHSRIILSTFCFNSKRVNKTSKGLRRTTVVFSSDFINCMNSIQLVASDQGSAYTSSSRMVLATWKYVSLPRAPWDLYNQVCLL
ncbi:hypothetical protein ABFV05_016398 [Capra hircus]